MNLISLASFNKMYGLFIYSTVLKKSIIKCNVKHVYINRKITVASITLLTKKFAQVW